jgi:hypothetical protein
MSREHKYCTKCSFRVCELFPRVRPPERQAHATAALEPRIQAGDPTAALIVEAKTPVKSGGFSVLLLQHRLDVVWEIAVTPPLRRYGSWLPRAAMV